MSGVVWRFVSVWLLLLGGGAPVWAAEVVAMATSAMPTGSALAIIEVWKTQRQLELREGDAVVGRFQIVLGTQPHLGKEMRGDGRTPVGRYYVSEKKSDSRFHRFLGISYPNADDAERAYHRHLIGPADWADIFFADLRGDEPPASTRLGGRVGIHGFGNRPYLPVDWTEGCIAVSNGDIEVIYDRAPVGTLVIINE